MNYARSYKWDLVFLAESLDGGHVTYRSSRHFDVVNDNVLFDLYGDRRPRISAPLTMPAGAHTARAWSLGYGVA